MGNSNQTMPLVDFEKDSNSKSAFAYKKYIEGKNFERAAVAKRALRRKRLIFGTSVALALGIYSYTIVKIKQETFLDDFEEPPRIIKSE